MKIEKEIIEIKNRLEKVEKIVLNTQVVKKKKDSSAGGKNIDFELNERAFTKRYAVDRSGPKKFTILLAYLAKGEINKNIKLTKIKKRWNNMAAKTLLGKFNMFYPNESKTKGWIDSKEYGVYSLTKEWRTAL